MLFLAVFCGFLAEYQLEHKIEKDREKQYMEGMIEDLHTDTTTIQSSLNLAEKQLVILDSLVNILNTEEINENNIGQLYILASNSSRVATVIFENRTSSQLKNSGGMRLIRKKAIADSVLFYWKHVELCAT